MIDRRDFVKTAASLALASLGGGALAQSWPNRPLRIIVPFAPGGTSDVIARLISKPLSDALGVPVIVENKTGANGIVGAAATAQAIDEHTLLLSDMSSLAISPLVTKDMPYKPADLKGATMLAYSPHLLVAHPSVQASNMIEAGVPGFDMFSWQAVYAPKGTPRPVIERLNAEIVKILRQPEVREKLGGLGMEVVGSTPEELAALMSREIPRWAALVKKSGATAN